MSSYCFWDVMEQPFAILSDMITSLPLTGNEAFTNSFGLEHFMWHTDTSAP